ncbi:NAD(P)H nitroreductase [Mycobacterium asiaticum]|uniref:NAD(P)H nitroreductase n=1 Tax=Mycobacterium asiaticum TaxID=1790 RepID=A0A1A3CJ93_MYCAS|nr:NAD(P)H nitroreductase [Mycobacterium asiaticum]OBI87015.1 NAD(P)H nitroreductase [Mycobacterium asiaticum]OBJ90150.1 NAD(P)H nitroreductase [Mycobacterium asiaticum]
MLRNAVLLACRAPSVHNSQPWRWVAEGNAVHLFVDRNRTVPATDDSGREALVSCGAALDHLRVAMTAAGWGADTVRFPNPNNRDHLATLEFSATDQVTAAQRDRAGAILQRRTDRLPFDRPVYWNQFETVLRSTLDNEAVTLDVLDDEKRPRLVEASQLSEALRRDDVSYHAELDWWTSPFVLSDGMPPSALVSDTERLRVDVAREFPVRGHQDRRPEVATDWSKILVLSTPEDTRPDILRCGETLSEVLLECTMAGMATCTLTHLIEASASRDIVRDLIGGRGEPQVLIRVGITPVMETVQPPTPRRPLNTVLEFREPSRER